MNTRDALLSGIVADPLDEARWLVLAEYLKENDDPRRAELLCLHRRLLATCCEPDAHPERPVWQARVTELLAAGVVPCVPRHTLELPGGEALEGAFVPPGSFLMGGTESDPEKPVHRVTLASGCFMGIYPVTQAQWKAVLGTEPSQSPGPNKPVEAVTWLACQEFCAKLTAHAGGSVTVRLPTEAEWEHACRAGTTTHFHFGDVPSTDLLNYSGIFTWNGSVRGKNRKTTSDVNTFPPNPWGLFDMHGNVWEWCSDEYRLYSDDGGGDQMVGSDERPRAMRGGSWVNYPWNCRAASRDKNPPAKRSCNVGFRVCFCLN